MEDTGARVGAPIVMHQPLAGKFYSPHPMAKKRGLPLHPSNYIHQNNPFNNWNPKSWDWDSARFIAKPLQSDVHIHNPNSHIPNDTQNDTEIARKIDGSGEDETLRFNLGGGEVGTNFSDDPRPVSRPNKRVRSSGSPNYPKCQVDNCTEDDLSTAKDYHRRHKVCEVHSKAGKALVGNQMQRFCQQCSRFHPLTEFDEGKRSCRRRLAGHNRRRRKTQLEDSNNNPTQRLLVPGSRDNNCDMDIVNLLAVLAHAQGNNSEDKSGELSPIPDRDQLIQIMSKINSLPLPENLAAKLSLPKITSGGPNLVPSENLTHASSPSTMDFLAVLSSTPNAYEIQPQPRSDSENSKSPRVDQNAPLNSQRGGERSSTSYHSPSEDTSPSLPLQLFSSSPEDDSPRKLQSGPRNYLSSDSCEGRSPLSSSSSPVVHDLFPIKHGLLSNSGAEQDIGYVKTNVSNGCSTSLQLFVGGSTRATENGSIQNSPYQVGYASSSGSDHSPSSLLSDVQDRTGRISFKLFEKDPSHLPGSLRTQIYNWLSNSPSEMESYIRPGCVVLSMYLSMSSFAWDRLDENLTNYVKSLVQDIDVNFWGSGRFLIHTDRQMASHKDGNIRHFKSMRDSNTPELISVSPLAVVCGQDTSLLLRGRRLRSPGTEIHCTHADGYIITEGPSQETAYNEIILNRFKINVSSSIVLGRCFIEVENNFRGTIFPVIIAEDTICQELNLLETEINGIPRISREEALRFLNELGWLFQRKNNATLFGSHLSDYRLSRFKFLLVFSVEHDFCALVRTLLGILLELILVWKGLATESLEMLPEIHLLNRAVKRRCRTMVDLLVNCSVIDSNDSSEKYIFSPDLAGPGGVTPLHLAACTSNSDDLVDALTSDPKEVGLHCWNSVLDSNGLSPYAYALMRNNNSYNALVARKISDRKKGQVSVSIGNEIEPFQVEIDNEKKTTSKSEKSCHRCAVAAGNGYGKRFPGLLHRPYIHSMLVVAAVCVCVCVFLRGQPYVGRVTPFAWEHLEYGAI